MSVRGGLGESDLEEIEDKLFLANPLVIAEVVYLFIYVIRTVSSPLPGTEVLRWCCLPKLAFGAGLGSVLLVTLWPSLSKLRACFP